MSRNALTTTLERVLELTDTTDRFKDVRVWDFKLSIWMTVGYQITSTRYAMLDNAGLFVTALTKLEIDDLIERSAELAGHAVGSKDATPKLSRFADVRVYDFRTSKWLHPGNLENTVVGSICPMFDDEGMFVTCLFADDVKILIEKSAELTGSVVG